MVYSTTAGYKNSHLRIMKTLNLEFGEYTANITVFVPAYPELGGSTKIKKFGKLMKFFKQL